MATKKKEIVETADLKPKVTRARKPKYKWAEVMRGETKKLVCPHCGAELKEDQLRINYDRCPVCGENAK